MCKKDDALEGHRDASNRLTFDFKDIESKLYSKLTDEIVGHFGLEATSELTHGLDEIFQEYTKDDLVIGLERDNWSGYIVNAKTKESEALAESIAMYIKERYKKTHNK